MQQRQLPQAQDGGLIRSSRQRLLFDQEVVDSTTPYLSEDVECGPYRRFALYVRIKSTGTGAHVLQIKPEFLGVRGGVWHHYAQGPFASLYYEDTATATERDEVFEGICAGRVMRVNLTGTSVTSSLYFTVSIAVEFFN